MKKILLLLFLINSISISLGANENNNYSTEITTDGGITLYQNDKYYELVDNVIINSTNFDLSADNVIAYYKVDLYDLIKIIATGKAKIKTSDDAIISGDKIIYEIENGNFKIEGNGLFKNDKLTVKSRDIKGEIEEINNKKYIKKCRSKR